MIDAEPIGNPSDSGQLAPTAERLAPLLGVRPPAATAPPVQAPAVILVADAGYSSANIAVACEEIGFIPVFPVMRTVNPHGQLFNRTDFTHDAERDLMVCPAGKALAPGSSRRTGRSSTPPAKRTAAPAPSSRNAPTPRSAPSSA